MRAAVLTHRGGRDTALMRFTDLVITVPTIVIGAVIGKLSGQISAVVFAVSLGLILWTTLSRLVRGEFLALREREFVDAARVAGASSRRIIFKHILPNAIAPVLVYATIFVGGIIAAEATLSFLGIGLQLPAISWGLQINSGQRLLRTAPHIILFPSLFLSVTVLSFILLGDALRDALDPKLR